MANYFEEMISDEERARLQYIPTVNGLMEKCVREYGDQPAVADDQRKLTYRELDREAGRCRALLNSSGIPAGGHVGVMCRNNTDAMTWFLAVPTSGRVLLMLPCALNSQAVHGIAAKFDLSALVMDSEFMPLAEGLGIPVLPASRRAETPAAMTDVDPEDTAAIFFTGGTTGAPKGAMLPHRALMRGAFNGTFRPDGLVFGNRYILMLPLSHIFGAVAGFLSCLYTGSEIFGCHDVRAGIGAIPVLRPTQLVLVPGIVEILLNLVKVKGSDFLLGLRAVVCGAAPVPARLMGEFQRLGVRLFAGYGLTEGANLTSANIDTDVKPHSMGKLYPGQEYRLVNGELWLRGDNLMTGYYKQPEETAWVLSDGWLHTGDLASFDEDGFITITGRIKNVIILPNGENVSPEEIEDLLTADPIVRDCLVKEGLLNGRRVLAVEVLPVPAALQQMDPADLEKAVGDAVRRVNESLPAFKRVAKVTVRKEDFKRTGAMKIDRMHS